METLAEALANDIARLQKTKVAYAQEWGVPKSTFNEWLRGVVPTRRFHQKINERFPGTFHENETCAVEPRKESEIPQRTNGKTIHYRISATARSVTELVLLFEWLVLRATEEERKQFRDELGEEWEWFMNLARSLVNEKSLEVAKTEGRLNNTRRSGL